MPLDLRRGPGRRMNAVSLSPYVYFVLFINAK